MLKQIISGEKNIQLKFHGLVKHLEFECNMCHKKFLKMESYYKKQLKTRANACCFCSPSCRSKFLSQFSGNLVTSTKKRKGAISGFLRNLFS